MATGYTQNPDGTYTFELPDGTRITATGRAAEQRARELDAMRGAPAPIVDEAAQARLAAGLGTRAAGAIVQAFNPPPREEPLPADWASRVDWSRSSLAPRQTTQPTAPPAPQFEAGRFAGDGAPAQAPPRPSVVVLPGGEMLAGRTTQHGPGLTPEQQDLLAEQTIDRRLATQELSDAERAAQAGRTRAAVLEQQNYVREDARMREAEAARLAREEQALEASRQADEAAGDYVVNPSRFWSSASGWTKALAVLGSAVGGALATRSRDGRNHFAEALERLVAEDVEAQKEELAALERQARARRDHVTATQLANDRARLSDASLFEHRLQSASAWLRRIEAETQDPIITARARMADLDVQELLANRMIGADQERRGTEVRQYQNVPTQVVAVGGQDPSLPDYSPKELDAQARDYAQRLESRGIVEGAAALDDVDQMLLRYDPDESIPGLGLIKEHVPRWLLTEEGKLNRQRVSRLMDAYRVAVTGAGASNEELKRIEDSFRGAKTPAELRQAVRLSRDILTKRQRTLASGYDPRAIEIAEGRGAYRPPTAPSSLRRGAIGGQ